MTPREGVVASTEQHSCLRGCRWHVSLGCSDHKSSGSPILSSVTTWPCQELLGHGHQCAAQWSPSLEEALCLHSAFVHQVAVASFVFSKFCLEPSEQQPLPDCQRGSSRGLALRKQFGKAGVLCYSGGQRLLAPARAHRWAERALRRRCTFLGSLWNFVLRPRMPNYARELLADNEVPYQGGILNSVAWCRVNSCWHGFSAGAYRRDPGAAGCLPRALPAPHGQRPIRGPVPRVPGRGGRPTR